MEVENMIESVKEIDFSDLIKLQIINCLSASKEDNVMKLINTVALLEMLLLEDIAKSDYNEKIALITQELERKYPAYKTNREQFEMFALDLAKQKFGLLVLLAKQKTPVVIEIEDVKDEEEEVVEEVEGEENENKDDGKETAVN